MDFTIYDKDGNQVNIIHASADFVEKYCQANGYTYEPYPKPGPTIEERLAAIEAALAQNGGTSDVWDELDAAYQEGVNGAYDQ